MNEIDIVFEDSFGNKITQEEFEKNNILDDAEDFLNSLLADEELEIQSINLNNNINEQNIEFRKKEDYTIDKFSIENLVKEGFNPQQLKVIESDYPIVNIAGPGAGKTKTLIAKITAQVNTISDLKNTLVLTFTNAASNEILERLSEKLNVELDRKDFYAGTFHGMFYKILKENMEFLKKDFGFTETPRILDSNEDKHLFEKVLQSKLNNDGKLKKTTMKEDFFNLHGIYPLDVYYTINNAINGIPKDMIDIKQQVYDRSNSEDFNDLNTLDEIVSLYYKTKQMDNHLSFSDILMFTYFTLKNNKEMQTKVQEQFHYILVDEYQDTNPIQAAIIDLLSTNNTCKIGDPYQSIYKFLGASVKNIMNEAKKEDMNVIQLVNNYRSSENIVSLTNDLTSLFSEKIVGHQNCVSVNRDVKNLPIELKQCVNQEYTILNSIKFRIQNNKVPLSEIAILARTKNDTYSMEKLLRINKIPFIKIGGNEFYETKEVKFLINLAKVIAGEYSLQNIENVAEYYKGVGITALDKVSKIYLERANEKETFNDVIKKHFTTSKSLTSFAEFLWGNTNPRELQENLFTTNSGLEEGQIVRKADFETLEDMLNSENLTFEKVLIEKAETVGKKKDIENNISLFLEELKFVFSKDIDYIKEYLSDISLKTEADASGEVLEAITISTVHSAKGKEWNDVYVLNVEQGKFPSYRALDEELPEDERKKQIEEEKRLMYVAVSRAKEKLMLTSQYELNDFIKPFIRKKYVNLYTGNNVKGNY